DPQDPFHRQAKSRLPQPTSSKTCAVSAAPRSTSQPRSASPKPASRAFSNAVASADGREKLVAWLKYLENQSAKHTLGDPMANYDFAWLWAKLGIADLRR